MSGALSEVDASAVRDLIQRSSLKAIEYHEVSARLTGSRTQDGPADAKANINAQHRLDDEEFGIRLIGNITTEFGEVNVIVAVTYAYDGDLEPRTVLNFGNEVGIMTVFPYLREAISSITAKVFGEAILLPVLGRGAISFDVD